MAIISVVIVVFFFIWIQNVIYAKIWNRNLTAKFSFSRKNVFEGEEAALIEEIINRKFLPLPFISVKFQISRNLAFLDKKNSQVSDDYYRTDLFSIMAYQKINRTLPFLCCRRGYYPIKSIDLLSGNILMSSRFGMSVHSDANITVYPKLIDSPELPAMLRNLLGDTTARRFIFPDPFLYKGVREYQPYDSFKSIDFKATAKTGNLMVHTEDYTVSQKIFIYLNLQPYSSWPSRHLMEKAISLAASLSHLYISQGIDVGFTTGGMDIVSGKRLSLSSGRTSEHLYNIYEALARVDLDNEMLHMKHLLPAQPEDSSVFILISTYHEQDLLDEFYALKEKGALIYWVLPYEVDTVIKLAGNDDITMWEVKPGD